MNRIALISFIISLCSCPPMHAQFCNLAKGSMLYYEYEDFESAWKDTVVHTVTDAGENSSGCFTSMEFPVDPEHVRYPEGMATSSYVTGPSGKTSLILMSHESMKDMAMTAIARHIKNSNEDSAGTMAKLDSLIMTEGELRIPLKDDPVKGENIPESRLSLKIMIVKYTIRLDKGIYEGYEKVTVPAGTFNCLKVSYRLKTSFMMQSDVSYMREWYSKEYGLVKSETLDGSGKIRERRILHSISLP